MALPGTGTAGRRFRRLQRRTQSAATAQSLLLAEIDSLLAAKRRTAAERRQLGELRVRVAEQLQAARLLHLDVVEWLEPVGEVQRRQSLGAAVVCRREESECSP